MRRSIHWHGGDEGTQRLAVSVGAAATGFVARVIRARIRSRCCMRTIRVFGGWLGRMSLDFTDFGVGEQIVFGVDVDPTSIQGVPGAGGGGAASGSS